MKVMILAAGMGTRLRPLNDIRPKPLVPVANRPVIERTISYLKGHGTTRIAVNTHHLAPQMDAFLQGVDRFGLPVEVFHEPQILGTAGGLRNAAGFWGEDTLVAINGDILTDIDLGAALDAHRRNGAPVTLVLHACPPFNQILVDEYGTIRDIASRPHPERLAFTGIHIVEPSVLDAIPGEGFADIVSCYRRMISDGARIAGHRVSGHRWRDIGTIPSYMQANREWAPEPILLGEDCSAGPSVRLREWVVAGAACRFEPGSEIRRSVLWEGVTVREGVRVVDSVVTGHRTVERDLIEGTL